MTYYGVSVGTESKEEAGSPLTTLHSKQLVTGGQVVAAPAQFLWKWGCSYYASVEVVRMFGVRPLRAMELLPWIKAILGGAA